MDSWTTGPWRKPPPRCRTRGRPRRRGRPAGGASEAKGILMAAWHITADEAFGLLVQRAQNDNVKLRVVAEQLIEHACWPGQ
ncbi:ANTAR domain-containing protein [Amycolatopsis plumensis]|uniref:ANTAR domain-containing protein n=1 Tax=Amycolatopsis plumensis TaxID=236508 RepID=A0ABV5U3P4_9PSEU